MGTTPRTSGLSRLANQSGGFGPPQWGRMFQGGDRSLQDPCERFNSFRLHASTCYADYVKICSRCNREYDPSSRHKTCSRCRHVEKKRPCPICGERETAYERCKVCAYSARRNTGHGSVTKDGYRQIWVDGKSVLEHRQKMATTLGRPLLKGETVHHKNGKRDDNEDANLELWVSNHPSGQRIEDVLEWAREMIRRYQYLGL